MELLMSTFPIHVRLPGQSLEEVLSGKSYWGQDVLT